MTAPLLASATALMAVVILLPPPGRALRRLAPRPPSARSLAALTHRLKYAVLAVLTALAVGLAFGTSALVSAATVTVIVRIVLVQRAKSRRQSQATLRRAEVIEACDTLAAELSAGRTPQDALEGAAEFCPHLRPAAAAARLGGDVPAVLRLAAETPGAESLRALAAAWQVADRSGAAVAQLVDRLTSSLRADESLRRQLTANLAGARTTARLLAVLPLFGTLLGYLLGADPLAFLTATLPGIACLSAGLGLAVLGLWWTERLTRTPETR